MSVAWPCLSGRGEWPRTGVIGSSLSPQTGGTFHHRGISFQFSKPHNTSDAIYKVFFQTRGGKTHVSSYLIIPLIAPRRENKLPCSEKKTRLKCVRRRQLAQRSNATPTLNGQHNTRYQATAPNYQNTNKQSHPSANPTAANINQKNRAEET